MNYELGDPVVVPGCGMGHIAVIEENKDLGIQMYRIDLEHGDTTLWVPVHLATSKGLRPPMSEDTANEAFDVIRQAQAPEKRGTWNRRQRRYNEQLMSNQPTEMAELYGELASVGQAKPLSFGERRILERVRELLIGELAAALGVARPDVESRLEAALA